MTRFLLSILLATLASCALRDSTHCSGEYTPDDIACAEYFCMKNSKDSRCVDSGDTMDGGEVDSGPHGHDGGKDASEGTDAATVRCNGPEDCTGSLSHCSPAGECVACTMNDHCPATSPVCSENACVGCTSPGDCSDRAGTLACDSTSGDCVECTEADDSACTAGKVCKADGNECVECNAHSDCKDPSAARCDATMHQCVPCQDNAQCQGVSDGTTALSVCNASQSCVECTGTDYTACGTNDLGKQHVCNSLTQTCSQQTEGGRGLCASCDSDAACAQGQRCVMQHFKGQNVGYFCVWEQGAQGAPVDCALARPYVQTQVDAVSIDGHKADVCTLATTTCPAIQQFRTAQGACGSPAVIWLAASPTWTTACADSSAP